MVNITFSIPEDMKEDMNKFPEINWSAIAREAIKKRIIMLEKFKEFTMDSRFTEEDSLRLGREINKRVSKKYKSKCN